MLDELDANGVVASVVSIEINGDGRFPSCRH
jgi:hypothetical protein